MKTINPDIEKLPEVLNNLPTDVPIVMINLLKCRDNAHYPEGIEADPCTGREAYQRYSEIALSKVSEALPPDDLAGGRAWKHHRA